MSYRLSVMIFVERPRAYVTDSVRRPTWHELLVVTNRRYGGVCCPGGKVEHGETFESAAKRELLEETGLTADVLVKLGAIDHPALPKDKDKTRWLCMAFRALFDDPGNVKPRQMEEGTLPHWITPKELLAHDLYPEWYKWAFRLAGIEAR